MKCIFVLILIYILLEQIDHTHKKKMINLKEREKVGENNIYYWEWKVWMIGYKIQSHVHYNYSPN
jgi:hypothetical protein